MSEKSSKAGLIVLALKLGPKALKMVKSLKFAGSAGSLAAYSYLFTWEFAVLILASLVWHEYGHLRAMKRCGHETKGMYLIPFVGGAAVSKTPIKTRWEEVYISMMGPTYGLIQCLAMLGIYYVTGNEFIAAATAYVAFINIFNLLPINPLDGGRVAKSIAFSLHSVVGFFFISLGLLACAVGFWYFGVGLMLFIFIIGAIELATEYKEFRNEIEDDKAFQKAKSMETMLQEKFDIFLQCGRDTQIKNGFERFNYYIADKGLLSVVKVNYSEKDETAKVVIQKPKTVTPMNKAELIGSCIWYIGLTAILVGIAAWVAISAIPGGDIPMMLLSD